MVKLKILSDGGHPGCRSQAVLAGRVGGRLWSVSFLLEEGQWVVRSGRVTLWV